MCVKSPSLSTLGIKKQRHKPHQKSIHALK
jgi:hypothetical protein